MKVSVVTPVYNNERTIAHCIESVDEQSYSNIEHIIIDGESTDNTLKIINQSKGRVSRVISEPDDGIYDAQNKGLRLASGDVLVVLNSDDYFASSTVIENVVSSFEKNSVDVVYGDALFVDEFDTNKVIRYWKTGEYSWKRLKRGWEAPHPSFFVKKSIYEKYGYLNTELRISADFELMLRFLGRYKVSSSYLNQYLASMRYGGDSNQSLSQRYKGNKECYLAWKSNGFKIGLSYSIIRLCKKVTQLKVFNFFLTI
ncbi:glycosyl transferase [Candidatus Marinamargulisbacteria bacterium SCGC AG-439-L15]|nr:glycosyl transferase [Candidatus Marinamargulisbacteria bacterium SCGC AG-439-L15]